MQLGMVTLFKNKVNSNQFEMDSRSIYTGSRRSFRRTNKGKLWARLWHKFNQRRIKSDKPLLSKTSFLENAHEFARNTTLHGLKFVGNKNINSFERIFFLVAFIISLAVALNFIANIYDKWSSTPVIIANSASNTYINEIPFPAITICNMNQALKSKVSAIDRHSLKYTVLQTMCYREDTINITQGTMSWKDFEGFILESTQKCSEMLVLCRFAAKPFNCSDKFRAVLTDEGRCCVFNAVNASFMYVNESMEFIENSSQDDDTPLDWTPESGYPKVLPKKFSPAAAVGTGFNMGLTLILNASIDEYHCSSTNGPGFKIRLHSPVEIPNVGDNGFSVEAGYETRVVVTPNIHDASDAVLSMGKQARQCVYGAEANLSFFRTYSRRNCEMECEARLVAEECSCILDYMPRIKKDIPICGVKESACYDAVNVKVQTANQEGNNCSEECVAACFDLTYDAVTFASPILRGSFRIRERTIQRMQPGYAEKNIAVVHFYYIENAFRSTTKEQFVGLTEFLSSTGGIMGLFIGFSVISLVEMLYYGTFRPIFAGRRYKKQNKSDEFQRIRNVRHRIVGCKP